MHAAAHSGQQLHVGTRPDQHLPIHGSHSSILDLQSVEGIEGIEGIEGRLWVDGWMDRTVFTMFQILGCSRLCDSYSQARSPIRLSLFPLPLSVPFFPYCESPIVVPDLRRREVTGCLYSIRNYSKYLDTSQPRSWKSRTLSHLRTLSPPLFRPRSTGD